MKYLFIIICVGCSTTIQPTNSPDTVCANQDNNLKVYLCKQSVLKNETGKDISTDLKKCEELCDAQTP